MIPLTYFLSEHHDVPHHVQGDSQTWQGYRMCYSSTLSMFVEHRYPGLIMNQFPAGRFAQVDDAYLTFMNRFGDTTDSTAHSLALVSLGLDAYRDTFATISKIKKALSSGYSVPVGILVRGHVSAPRGGGHWILLVGYDEKGFIVNDPAGELDLINGGYIPGTSGEGLHYSYANFKKRFFVRGRNSGWAWFWRV